MQKILALLMVASVWNIWSMQSAQTDCLSKKAHAKLAKIAQAVAQSNEAATSLSSNSPTMKYRKLRIVEAYSPEVKSRLERNRVSSPRLPKRSNNSAEDVINTWEDEEIL